MSASDGIEFLKRDFTEWNVVRSFFCANGHNRHQIDGFNKFCREILPQIVLSKPEHHVTVDGRRHTVRFLGVSMDRPSMREADGDVHPVQPFEARVRNLTYSCPVYLDIEYVRPGPSEGDPPVREVRHRVPFFSLPCMVMSDMCTLSDGVAGAKNAGKEDPFERGGFVVTNGIEKAVVPQLKLRVNLSFVWPARKNDKYSMVAEVRSDHPGKWRSTSTLRFGLVERQHRTTVFAFLPFVMRGNGFLEVPLVLLFLCLGLEGGREAMLRQITFPDCAPPVRALAEQVVAHPMADMTRAQALEWVAAHGLKEKTRERREATARGIFANEVLPHIGSDDAPGTNARKCLFLGRMARKLLQVHLGRRPIDDRDSFANKNVHNTGTLIAVIFRQIHRNTCKIMCGQLYKTIASGRAVNLADLINHRKVTSSLRWHFSTGNWSMQQNTNTGVVMPMPRVCHQVAVSFQRRINTQCNKDSRATECRLLHPSDLGINCINETPEGQSCGIIENLAMFTHISMGVPSDAVVPLLRRLGDVREVELPLPPPPDRALLMVNGRLEGTVARGEGARAFVDAARASRLRGGLPFDLSVLLTSEGDVHVSTEVGRCLRPLFRADRLHLLPAAAEAVRDDLQGPALWRELLRRGIVEYLDKSEEMSVARPAPRVHDLEAHPERGYTHVEIDPVASLGLLSATQPFPERNQSPRNIYQATMGKQCISVPMINWDHRVDRHLHVLNYPQQPVVTTQLETVQDYDRYPHGMSAVVAIMCYGGFNQEDSILFSQSAIDRGFGRVTYYRTYSNDIKRSGAYDTEQYEIPGPNVYGIKGKADYSKLGPDGFVRVGETVVYGDVLVGKTVCVSEVLDSGQRNTIKYDQSVVMREHDVGRVDKVILTSKPDGNMLVHVRIRFVRAPVVGDKFASRYAQKGTIGAVLPREDMPFTVKDGIVPDIIMNPNAIPSRMTVGQLIESALGKAALMSGRRGNGTAFRGARAQDIMAELKRHGFEGGGKERMRNGMTGELIEAPIFIGPTYYQELKHFVKDKIHSRSDDGSNRMLTRQPMEGRSRGGGFRFGEMERDAVICHGASRFMMDRMFYNSDKYFVPVCLTCGTIAIPKTNTTYGASVHREDWCAMCDGRSTVRRVRMPYATKLCLQELVALHVMPRVRLKTIEDLPSIAL